VTRELSSDIRYEIRETINKIKEAIERRELTDLRLSSAWIAIVILVPLLMFSALLLVCSLTFSQKEELLAITATINLTGFEVIVAFLVMLSACSLVAVLYYKLILRMNLHFRRSSLLREGVVELIVGLSKLKNAPSYELAHIKALHSELKYKEVYRAPGLHALLSVIVPFYWLYVSYFLTSQWQDHEFLEREFFKETVSTLRTLGAYVPTIYWEEMPRRSPGLYITLTILLGGLFSIYWLWTLIKDPEKHFISHKRLEEALLGLLDELSKSLT
jgi:hypothetical protein